MLINVPLQDRKGDFVITSRENVKNRSAIDERTLKWTLDQDLSVALYFFVYIHECNNNMVNSTRKMKYKRGDKNFHDICKNSLMQSGYGIEWLCRWDMDIVYLLSFVLGVIFLVMLCHRPKKVG